MIKALLFSHSVFAPTGTAQSSQDMLNGLLSNGCAVTFVTLEEKNKDLIYSVNFENEKKLKWITYLKPQNLLSWRNHFLDRKSTRLNSSHIPLSRMPSSA